MIRWVLSVIALTIATGATATDLVVPAGARETVTLFSPLDSARIPLDVYRDGAVAMQDLEGAVTRKAWRLDATDLTLLQAMAPLRDQVLAEGFSVILDCVDTACGGFDFRFATEVLPGPNMYVNLRSFHHVTAIKGALQNPDTAVTLLVSKASSSLYVQMIRIERSVSDMRPTATAPGRDMSAPDLVAGSSSVRDSLLEHGHVILPDLTFETGRSELGSGPFASLEELADFLAQTPDARIALVGHTDTVGSLDANISLSRQRAQSVRQRLTDQYGVQPGRLDAEGMGYLAPIASNRTDDGREANRRVEAVLLN